MFGIIVLLKCPPSFHLHHPGRWQQIFIKNISVLSSIYSSSVCQYHMLKSGPTLLGMVGFFGMICSAISPPNVVSYYGKSLVWWAMGFECITFFFLFLTIVCANSSSFWSGPWLLNNSSHNFFTLLSENLTAWLWLVYGEVMFLLLPDHGPNSFHWNIQKLRNPSVTNAISMFSNNEVAKV